MLDPTHLKDQVRTAYSHVAEAPGAEHPFKVGRDFALGLGYPANWLDALPGETVDAFTGVSAVSVFAELPEGARVLDLGCGAGLDSLIAARRVGPGGQVTGVDFSPAMLARGRAAAQALGFAHVNFEAGDAEALPLDTASVDIALVNGIFNLNPERGRIMRELARVVRPGGAVFVAELVLREPLSDDERAGMSNWFS
jgi:SAM-dependent methyltransferase